MGVRLLDGELWDGPDHKFIKEGHGEGDITVRGAVNHAFPDQLGPHRTQAADFDAKGLGNVAGALRPGSEVGNGPQEIFFAGSEPVEADAEEIRVEPGNDLGRGILDDVQGNGTGWRKVPSLVTHS